MEKIVVGTDGSASAAVALRWAAEEAELHGAALEAVLAWSYLDQHHPDGQPRISPPGRPQSPHGRRRTGLGDARTRRRGVAPHSDHLTSPQFVAG